MDEGTAGLARETARYQKLNDETRAGMKEIGHVQNFAEVIERELMVLEETLRMVDDGEDEGEGQDDPREGEGVKTKKKGWWF